jgi:putative ABC transport system permease protein
VLRGSSPSDKPAYASLSVRVKSPSLVDATEKKIKDLGFSAFSLLDASKSLRIFFSVFDLLLGIFGSLALAVATLGIVNTLVMAILVCLAFCSAGLSARRSHSLPMFI